MRTTRHLLIAFVTATAFWFAAGCASLPDVPKVTREAPAGKAPTIVSAKGVLTPEQSKAIMERLQRAGKPTDLLLRHEAVLEMVSGSPLTKGNKATLLLDGKSTYAAMFRVIENATDTINLETYKIEDDDTGRQFVDLLLRKQSEGVQVNFMYDSIGSLATSQALFERLRKAGVRVVEANPVNPLKPGDGALAAADHSKLLIVDGRVAITGGVNISQVYASTPFQRERKKRKPPMPWRDTDVIIQGPAVAEFQRCFMENWQRQKGPSLYERRYFPKLKEEGHAFVRAISSTPGEKNRLNYISYLAALMYAEHSIHLTSAYFIPDDRILDALTGAARRGVDVTIIVPSVTDSSAALYAMRYNFTELLKAGVKVYQRRNALLHAKTAVIDGVWSTVGSTNMDLFSLSRNYEINAVIISPDFAAAMEQTFRMDLAQSEQITWEKWKKRSLMEKSREMLTHMFSHLM